MGCHNQGPQPRLAIRSMILHGFHELHDAPVIRKSLSDIFNVMKHGLLDKISPRKSAVIFLLAMFDDTGGYGWFSYEEW